MGKNAPKRTIYIIRTLLFKLSLDEKQKVKNKDDSWKLIFRIRGSK